MIRFALRSNGYRLAIVATLSAAALLVLAVVALRGSFDSPEEHNRLWASGSVGRGESVRDPSRLNGAQLNPAADEAAALYSTGHVIMPKLGNATAKAELGRASWKLLHTMAARFPENPTENERETFKSFLHMFSRLYPCGECATEFQQLLRKHPPQTSSRGVASMYLCHLHNLVNDRLGKDEFDCGENLKEIYDCGCGDDDEGKGKEGKAKATVAGRAKGEAGSARAGDEVLGLEDEVSTGKPGRTRVSFGEGDRDPVTGLELVGG